MFEYIVRRLILLPITLFFIIIVNFVIINLAPGEPVTLTEISQEGAATRKEDRSVAFGADERYLQFREHYGLTLPILFNTWPYISEDQVKKKLWALTYHKSAPQAQETMSVRDYDDMRITFGDQARFIMPKLLEVIEDPGTDMQVRRMAVQLFIRGGTRQAYLGPDLTEEQKAYNRKIAKDNNTLNALRISPDESEAEVNRKIAELKTWYGQNKAFYNFEPGDWQKAGPSLSIRAF